MIRPMGLRYVLGLHAVSAGHVRRQRTDWVAPAEVEQEALDRLAFSGYITMEQGPTTLTALGEAAAVPPLQPHLRPSRRDRAEEAA